VFAQSQGKSLESEPRLQVSVLPFNGTRWLTNDIYTRTIAMAYELSIEVFGTGEDPNHRSHWGFVIHRPSLLFGDLLHVKAIDLDRLWYEFDPRMGTPLVTMQALGMVKIGAQ
jgi:hypothetical protein